MPERWLGGARDMLVLEPRISVVFMTLRPKQAAGRHPGRNWKFRRRDRTQSVGAMVLPDAVGAVLGHDDDVARRADPAELGFGALFSDLRKGLPCMDQPLAAGEVVPPQFSAYNGIPDFPFLRNTAIAPTAES